MGLWILEREQCSNIDSNRRLPFMAFSYDLLCGHSLIWSSIKGHSLIWSWPYFHARFGICLSNSNKALQAKVYDLILKVKVKFEITMDSSDVVSISV